MKLFILSPEKKKFWQNLAMIVLIIVFFTVLMSAESIIDNLLAPIK